MEEEKGRKREGKREIIVHLSIVDVLEHSETLPIVEIPELQGAVFSSREESAPTPIKGHGCDLVVAMAIGELDHLLSRVHVPNAHN